MVLYRWVLHDLHLTVRPYRFQDVLPCLQRLLQEPRSTLGEPSYLVILFKRVVVGYERTLPSLSPGKSGIGEETELFSRVVGCLQHLPRGEAEAGYLEQTGHRYMQTSHH